jgi:hypothetical protein
MDRSAAVLLLTLVLGVCVAASADDKHYDDSYEHEKPEKVCRRSKKPWSYDTYGCPTCKSNAGCIKTECSEHYEGKADVTIDVKCLFGEHFGFVAVSYKDGGEHVCVNNQEGHDYMRYITLEKLKCSKPMPKLRFIVQDKRWWNSEGKDLDKYDSCHDKCTKGKPCHTCIFKDIRIPDCKKWCKHDKCDPDKKWCPKPKDVVHCFDYEAKRNYVKVTLKKDCRKEYSHIAVSYDEYDHGHKAVDYKYTYDDHKDYSFKAECDTYFTWFFEDKDYYNPYAPTYPSHDDECYQYFVHGKACNQCGPYKKRLPECYHDEYKKDEPKNPKKDDEKGD